MTIKELCMRVGAPLLVQSYRPRKYEPIRATHRCHLDPKRCTVIVDGRLLPKNLPIGVGVGEAAAMADLVRGLRAYRQNWWNSPVHTVVVRCQSVYDNAFREIEVPADLTAEEKA